jgi:hypothetical protein
MVTQKAFDLAGYNPGRIMTRAEKAGINQQRFEFHSAGSLV